MFRWLSIGVTLGASILVLSSVTSAKTTHHHPRPTTSASHTLTGHSKVAGAKTQTGVASVYARQHQGKRPRVANVSMNTSYGGKQDVAAS